MSYSSMLLVQPLYDVQKQIDLLFKKYKDKVFEYDQNVSYPDGSAPKNAVVHYYTNMVYALNKYNIIKASIKNEKAIADRQVIYSKYLVYTVVTIIAVIAYTMLIRKLILIINVYKDVYGLSDLVITLYFLILTTVILYTVIFQIINPITNSYLNKYEIIYNTNVFNKSYAIKNIIDMMDVDTTNVKRSKTGDVYVVKKGQSSNPMMMWWLSYLKSLNITFDYMPINISAESLKKEECDEKLVEEESGNKKDKKSANDIDICSPSSKGCITGYVTNIKLNKKTNRETILNYFMPCDLQNYVQPFNMITSDDIHSPKYLLKELESYDKYNQVNRINKAILYFKGLLLRKNDADYQPLIDEEKKTLASNLTSILQLSSILVKNVGIPQGSRFDESIFIMENISGKQAISKCMNDEQYAGVVIKDDICFLILKSDKDIVLQYNKEPDEYSFAFIKSDSAINTTIYTRYEPDQDNLNRIFSYNLENSEEFDLYSFCISNEDNVCLNKAIFKSKEDVNYNEVLGVVSEKEMEFYYNYRTEFKSLYKINFESNMKDSLIYVKDVIISKLKDTVIQTDPTLTYRINQDEILSAMENYYGEIWTNVSDVVFDIINETNNELMYAQKQTENNEFISFEKFSLKVGSIKQDIFLNQYLFNINEIRFTSKNLHNLHEIYDYSTEMARTSNNVIMSTFYTILLIGLFECIRRIIIMYLNFKENDRLENKSYYKFKLNVGEYNKKEYEFQANAVKLIDSEIGKRESDKWKPNYLNKFSDFLVQSSIIFFIYLFSMAFCYAWAMKRWDIYNFNQLVSSSNGRIIVEESNTLFHDYIFKLNDNVLFPMLNGYKIKQDTLEDMQIDYIIENNNAGAEKDVILDGIDLESHYEKLKNILTSYDKCNYLLDDKIESVPFPVLEFLMYLLVLIVVLIVIIYLFSIIKPLEKLELIKILLAIRNIKKNGQIPSESDLKYVCDIDDNLNTSTIIKVIMFLLIIVATLFISLLLYSNTNSFKSSLYTSDLFKENNCYIY